MLIWFSCGYYWHNVFVHGDASIHDKTNDFARSMVATGWKFQRRIFYFSSISYSLGVLPSLIYLTLCSFFPSSYYTPTLIWPWNPQKTAFSKSVFSSMYCSASYWTPSQSHHVFSVFHNCFCLLFYYAQDDTHFICLRKNIYIFVLFTWQKQMYNTCWVTERCLNLKWIYLYYLHMQTNSILLYRYLTPTLPITYLF